MNGEESKAPLLVDLFCGAGGLVTGFASVGFETVLASDIWVPAAETYQCNHLGHRFVQSDIRDLDLVDELKEFQGCRPLVIAGGPPCQGFSSAGARSANDERNTLVSVYAKRALSVDPDVIVFENVEGFLTAEGGKFVLDLLAPLVEAGYKVRLEKLNVANFGVPQLRKRVIAIAAKRKIPVPLQISTMAFGMPGADLLARDKPNVKGIIEYLQQFQIDSESDSLSEVRRLSGIEYERVSLIPQGGTMKDLPEELQHKSWGTRANRRVRDGIVTEKRGGAPVGIRRLKATDPSKAITSAATREFIHPEENRMLTLREAALLQTFPVNYEFVGNKSEIATLIGNAIPPVFAAVLGKAVKETLSADMVTDTNGGIVELSLTNSTGMSPALARTKKLITANIPDLSNPAVERLF
ncbi:DNA cytosine methyltransferase [Canibacter sp. lx-45]|uniref:DNA cytosine methyltransferase n=1 Tax=Canibacter zhuwentaonis TaxID=2837491 RepID=UPI001BDC3C70|nr:DNA cytosine methyltransferase [Canibacter zhuwentaonis]MBT1034880.1 DNA cytosine methyltransferase [Canibacter zhuwentaonis]